MGRGLWWELGLAARGWLGNWGRGGAHKGGVGHASSFCVCTLTHHEFLVRKVVPRPSGRSPGRQGRAVQGPKWLRRYKQRGCSRGAPPSNAWEPGTAPPKKKAR